MHEAGFAVLLTNWF